jgi:hypothetical protein
MGIYWYYVKKNIVIRIYFKALEHMEHWLQTQTKSGLAGLVIWNT